MSCCRHHPDVELVEVPCYGPRCPECTPMLFPRDHRATEPVVQKTPCRHCGHHVNTELREAAALHGFRLVPLPDADVYLARG